jgi:carbamoyltransferase
VAAHQRRTDADGTEADPDDLDAVVAQVRSTIPAVTHVDGSARLQTVDAARNPEFHRLLTAFAARTGCPVLLNTSFNTRDEPVVCTPDDAHRTFERSGLDLLVLEHCLVERGS